MACDAAGNLSLSYEFFADNMQREEPFGLLSVAKQTNPRFFTCELVCDETDDVICTLSIEKT